MLNKLIKDLSNYLDNYYNLKNMKHCLVNYISDDWKNYIDNPNTGYKRIPIYNCKDFEIILICWSSKSKTPIHDHSENGCLMKILEGNLEEELYNKHLNKIGHFIRNKNDVNYIDNSIGYHKIINNKNPTYSLHIYSPVNYIANKFD